MNLFRQWPAALLSLAALGAAASAQEPPRPVEPTARPAAGTDMREDVEILRRLLDQALLKAYGLPDGKADGVHSYGPIRFYPLIGQAQLSTDGTRLSLVNGASSVPDIEGVYLKDYGAVYTATLPSPTFDPVAGVKADAGGKAPLDPWERTRKELRGETPEPEGKAVSGHQPLSEVILKVLADNGRHFSALANGERVTVAVTFRGAANCANCHQSATWQNLPPGSYPYQPSPGRPGGASGFSPPRRGMSGGASVPPSGSPPPEDGVGTATTRTAQEAPAWLNDVRNQILLGDLHLKQGKSQQATDAYQEALDNLSKVLAQKGLTLYEGPGLFIGVELYNKLAQSYVAAGNPSAAREMLQKASDLSKKASTTLTGVASTVNPQTPGAPALPNKLVVTASKKLLDEVGTGKLTFEAFCKAATVEYTGDAGGNAQQAVQTSPGAGAHP